MFFTKEGKKGGRGLWGHLNHVCFKEEGRGVLVQSRERREDQAWKDFKTKNPEAFPPRKGKKKKKREKKREGRSIHLKLFEGGRERKKVSRQKAFRQGKSIPKKRKRKRKRGGRRVQKQEKKGKRVRIRQDNPNGASGSSRDHAEKGKEGERGDIFYIYAGERGGWSCAQAEPRYYYCHRKKKRGPQH